MTRRMHMKRDSRGNLSYDEPILGTPEFYFCKPCSTIINLAPCHSTRFQHTIELFAKAVREGKPYVAPAPKKPKLVVYPTPEELILLNKHILENQVKAAKL